MRQDYFVHNDTRYETGTIIIISRFDLNARRVCDIEAKFLYYDTETKEYYLDIYGKTYPYNEKKFATNFRYIYDKNIKKNKNVNHTEETYSFADELNIDGMFIAWIWYIFIMVVAVIFYDRMGIWILASIVFFNYRSNKLKEAGYK